MWIVILLVLIVVFIVVATMPKRWPSWRSGPALWWSVMPTTVIFWVVTQLSGMSVKQGYKLQTLGTLVDGYGNVVADLGHYETVVKELLQWGETKRHIAVQAFAVDLCGDSRDELVLYQPYNGQAILIFTQPDSNGKAKPYVHEKDAYNIRSYF